MCAQDLDGGRRRYAQSSIGIERECAWQGHHSGPTRSAIVRFRTRFRNPAPKNPVSAFIEHGLRGVVRAKIPPSFFLRNKAPIVVAARSPENPAHGGDQEDVTISQRKEIGTFPHVTC